MNSGKKTSSPKLDLKLNLSPPMANLSPAESPRFSTSSNYSNSSSNSEMSIEGSCVSSEVSRPGSYDVVYGFGGLSSMPHVRHVI
ncbi:hypothetical protein O6P43_000502 [Quillaja saponaria]|uniref:Uncharacterized protein n=1 Tax=Quillaja saponaria TaxID=32244 RepID=A0AAD7QGN9_QUISA|nr:hypothetical protein O6P43_000502 [Quillaja saponaria]